MTNEKNNPVKPLDGGARKQDKQGFPINLSTFYELLDKAKNKENPRKVRRVYLEAARSVAARATKDCSKSPQEVAGNAGNAISLFQAEIQQNSWSFAAFLVANTLILNALVTMIGADVIEVPRIVFALGAAFGLAITILWWLVYYASTIMHDHTFSRVESLDSTPPPPRLLVRRRYAMQALIVMFLLAYVGLLVFMSTIPNIPAG